MWFNHTIISGNACNTPVSSTDGSPTCSPIEGEDGSLCMLDCVPATYSPSQPLPVYQSCSKYGMWDQHERLTDYIYPTCAGKTWSDDKNEVDDNGDVDDVEEEKEFNDMWTHEGKKKKINQADARMK